ncbi:MAG: hypothetical protein MJZ15_08945 [Bacteroidales bacterium]|nr:hypothetical protein [Bacteroidales bacterium]
MKKLSELNIMQSHDEFEFMLIPTCNDYYIDNCEFYHIPCSYDINEGLMSSYPVSFVSAKLKHYGVVMRDSEYEVTLFTVGFDKEKFNNLKSELASYGWYIATVKTGNITSKDYNFENSTGSVFFIEAKFQNEVSVPKTLYHVTPTKNVKKIMNVGLTARSQCATVFNYPERVYLLNITEDIVVNACKNYAKQSEKRYDSWTVLKIDTTKTKNVYYKDINVPNNVAVWTGEPISPSAITILNNFNI